MIRSTVLALAVLISACSFNRGPDMDALSAQVDLLVSDYPEAEVAVSIRDPSTGVVWDRLGDRLYHAASTMKVPVMIELFRQSELGRFSMQDSLAVVNAFRSIVDGSPYSIEDDSDDAIYGRLGTRLSIADLIDRMIVVSSNLATNLLVEFASADSIQSATERLGTRHMRTLRGVEDLKAYEQGLSNRTTSADLALLLEALMTGNAVSARADAAMLEIMHGQEMNEMIPAGLPEGVRIAHKTGQITAIHHDAGVVFPPQAEPFALVILIEGIEDDTLSAELGAGIARIVYSTLRGTG